MDVFFFFSYIYFRSLGDLFILRCLILTLNLSELSPVDSLRLFEVGQNSGSGVKDKNLESDDQNSGQGRGEAGSGRWLGTTCS